jgi:NADPH-dependent 2,4-dienoyl-CoA reductase/sulfur reductase-like enzyme
VVGAGWFGAEVATVAAAAGVDVTVVEAASTPLQGALGPQVGALTVPWYAAAGIRLLTEVRVTGVDPAGVRVVAGPGGAGRSDAAVQTGTSAAAAAGRSAAATTGTGTVATAGRSAAATADTGTVAERVGDGAATARVGDGAAAGRVDTGATAEPGQDAPTDETLLPADVVLVAVGARPATGWLGDAVPREPDGSVPVDEGHAPIGGSPRVRAVGDVARRRSARHGWVPGGHWDAALRGPAVAITALLRDLPALLDSPDAGSHAAIPADHTLPDHAPYVFSTQLGHEIGLYGLPDASDEVVLRGDPTSAEGWTALWFAPGTDRLTAVLAVDRPKDVAGARRLLAGPTLPDLDRERAADPAVPLPRTARA